MPLQSTVDISQIRVIRKPSRVEPENGITMLARTPPHFSAVPLDPRSCPADQGGPSLPSSPGCRWGFLCAVRWPLPPLRTVR